MKDNKKFRADIILIASLLVAGGIIAAVVLLAGKSGSTVVVKVDGQTIREFSLNNDTEYIIEGANGGRNILVIEGGFAWIAEADCPDGLCINMGKINKTGQSLVCLPHKVVVEIQDSISGDTGDIDVYVK